MSRTFNAALSAGASSRRARYEQMKAQLWTDRSSFDSHWRELGDWMMPRRTRFFAQDRNRGDKRNQNIIDSTATMSARTLSSGLHAGLTSPARPWFKLTTPDPELAEFKPVQEWLELVTRRMQVVFTSSNLYNMLPIVYGDMGVFGTAAMSLLDDKKDLFRCTTYPIGSYALGLDERGLATTFVREYELSVQQVVKEFGVEPGYRDIKWDRLSVTVKRLWENGNYTAPVQLLWVVCPNEQADGDRLGSQYLPWASCHLERGSGRDDPKGFLRESGFKSFPIMAPRWDITGEDTYGTSCPGMTALGDVKQLQLMHRRKAQAVNKMVDPPMKGVPELRGSKVSLLFGDITYLSNPDKGLSPIHEVRIDLGHLTADIGETQYRIQRAFYEDLFLMLGRMDEHRGGQPPTAREIDERHEEKLLALGPVLERTNDELLDPLVDRVYLLMDQAGLIPEAPQELQGVKLRVEYISIMAQAQKLTGVAGQDRLVQSVGALALTFPDAVDKIDVRRVIDNYGDMLGTDPRIIRSNDEADARTQAKAQAAKDAQDAEMAAKLAGAVKNASQAPLTGDTALERMTQAAAGGAL